ncbi:helix-turn-helix domain-containing protein [Actinoalloteichus fjordicus]|uniref:helix-turn-helix domain-containing protein n=1 Tax=Actinoalloteichus fjordicus TaxID=1612552 RepID=UPI001E3FDB47|nr:helix-turn-helix transcriptional regulator [Actinoalloteichus fjordicus]
MVFPPHPTEVGDHPRLGAQAAGAEQTGEPRTTGPWLNRAEPCHPGPVSRRELADFLRRRREALRPDQVDVGRPPDRRARRTPGLRREEVAVLAGMSISYYERLEQARASRPSPQVLAALGTALRFTTAEREHLRGWPGRRRPARMSIACPCPPTPACCCTDSGGYPPTWSTSRKTSSPGTPRRPR